MKHAARVERIGSLTLCEYEPPRDHCEDAFRDLTAEERIVPPKYFLRRMNRECGTDFDLPGFWHHAFFDPGPSRIEMRLVSRVRQTVTFPSPASERTSGEDRLRRGRSHHPGILVQAHP